MIFEVSSLIFNKRMTIKREVFYFGLVFTCLILAVFGVLFSINVFTHGIDNVKNFLRETNQNISIYTEGYFTEMTNTIEALSQNRDIRDAMIGDDTTRERALSLFFDFLEANQNILYIYAGYDNGVLLINDYTPPEGFDPRKRPWYIAAMEDPSSISTGVPFREAVSGEWVIAPSKALEDSRGEHSGVIAIDCSISSVAMLLGVGVEYHSQHSFVMNPRGKVIIHSDERFMDEYKPELLEMMDGEEGQIEYQLENQRMWGYYSIIDSTEWIVVTAVDRGEVIYPIISRLLWNALLIVMIAIFLGAIQSAVLGRRFGKPLMELGARISHITGGYPIEAMEEEARSYQHSNPEIAMIAQNIEQLAIQSLGRKASELRTIIESSRDGILVLGDGENLLYANSRFLEIWNLPQEIIDDTDSKRLLDLVVESILYPQEFLSTKERLNGTATEEILITTLKNGLILECFSTPLLDNGQVVGRLWNFRDITERKLSEERLEHLTFHDQVTGLYNRTFFEEEIKRLEDPSYLPLSIIMVDVNGLKIVNDSMGHQEGDRLLKKVAEILEDVSRDNSIVARCGGDEFVILLPHTSTEEAHGLCSEIEEACERAEQDPIKPSVALGYATRESTSPGGSMSKTIKEAEDYMYRHKTLSAKSSRSALVASLQKTLHMNSFETKEHVTNLQQLSLALGQRLKLHDSSLHELSIVALLHDIGKVAIAETILDKPGILSCEEWEIMRSHSEIGYRIAVSSVDLVDVANEILLHHEHWDGGGYPKGLKEEEIPLFSRIVHLVDAFDAMTHHRPYRRAMSKEEALEEIEKNTGSQFDPELVEIFLEMMKRDQAL